MAKQVAVAALLVCTMTGCSFALTSAPRGVRSTDPDEEPPRCSTSRVAPIADSGLAVAAALFGSTAGAGARDTASGGEDGELAGDFLGILGIGGAVVFAISAISAGYGFQNASRCEAARAPAPAPLDAEELRALIDRRESMDCREAFQALDDGRFLELASLPTGCELADAEAAFPVLAVAPAQSSHRLGRGRHEYDVRVATTRAGSGVRLWLDNDDVVAVHVLRPTLPLAWPQLRDLLGAPDAKVDAGTGDQSIYLARGLAVISLGESVELIALFPPVSVAEYEEHLALGVTP